MGEIVDRLLDGFESRGSMDVIEDLGEPLPAIITAEMLGVPVEDRHRLKKWSTNFAEMLGNFQHNPEHAQTDAAHRGRDDGVLPGGGARRRGGIRARD